MALTFRWFDKSISLQISQDGYAAVNFEHAWGDGVAVLRFVQDIYKDSKENPFVTPSTKPYDDNIQNVVRLGNLYILKNLNNSKVTQVTYQKVIKFFFLDFQLTDKLKSAITEAEEEYTKTCNSLDIDYLIFNKVGKNMCKKQAVSPDAVMQLGFQVLFHYTLLQFE